jgi:hypothetical protein
MRFLYSYIMRLEKILVQKNLDREKTMIKADSTADICAFSTRCLYMNIYMSTYAPIYVCITCILHKVIHTHLYISLRL